MATTQRLLTILAITINALVLGVPCSIRAPGLSVKATGVEASGNWAVVALRDGAQETLVDQGGRIGGCYQLTQVRSKSIVISSLASGEEREIFFSGFSSTPAAERAQNRSSSDPTTRALTEYNTLRVTPNLVRVLYPPMTNNNTLPQSIYTNTQGDALFDNLNELGLGSDAKPSDPNGETKGIEVGENSPTSILGSLGIRRGDRLVKINGQRITSPDQVGQILRGLTGAPIQISYAPADTDAVYSTATMIR